MNKGKVDRRVERWVTEIRPEAARMAAEETLGQGKLQWNSPANLHLYPL